MAYYVCGINLERNHSVISELFSCCTQKGLPFVHSLHDMYLYRTVGRSTADVYDLSTIFCTEINLLPTLYMRL